MNYVYLVRAGEGRYKVGVANNIRKRVAAIQTGNSHLIEVVTAKIIDKAYEAESTIHKRFKLMRTNGGKEWFDLQPEDVIEIAITINNFPGPEIDDKLTISKVLENQRIMQKSIGKQLDFVINTYQKKQKPKATIEPESYEQESEQVEGVNEDYETYEQAKRVVLEAGKASTSLLQRRLRIGYGKAARIMEMLEESKVVGPPDGSRPRMVIDEAAVLAAADNMLQSS